MHGKKKTEGLLNSVNRKNDKIRTKFKVIVQLIDEGINKRLAKILKILKFTKILNSLSFLFLPLFFFCFIFFLFFIVFPFQLEILLSSVYNIEIAS